MIIQWRIKVPGNIGEIRKRFIDIYNWHYYVESLKKETFKVNWDFEDKGIQARITGTPEYVEISGVLFFEDSMVACRSLTLGEVEKGIIEKTNLMVNELNRHYLKKEVFDGLIPKLEYITVKDLENSWWVNN
ncbi:MAG TPA: hypothetical protein PLI19_02485 [Erysipelotrichaceae bacterium]|nr:hypothetical protein [Erysipelotrichaceae bacterium]